MHVNINILAQSTLINNALAGTYQATRGASSAPSTPTSTTSGGRPSWPRAPWPSTWPATSTRAFRRLCSPGGRPTPTRTRVKAYQQINQYLAQDIPYLWLARDTWAVVANPKVQNFTNPTTLTGKQAIAFDEGVLWPTQIWMS